MRLWIVFSVILFCGGLVRAEDNFYIMAWVDKLSYGPSDSIELNFGAAIQGNDEIALPALAIEKDGVTLLARGATVTLEQLDGNSAPWKKEFKGEAEPPPPVKTRNGNSKTWKLKFAPAEFEGRTGIFHLRVEGGGKSQSSREFQILEVPDPKWIEIAYAPDRKSCLIGQQVKVQFTIQNKGTRDFLYTTGGDYRGSHRHLRFYFSGVSKNGVRTSDPHPDGFCMGGLGGSPRLKPGEKKTEEMDLLAYCKFTEPGVYTVTGYQDLDFGTPVKVGSDASYKRSLGGSFEIELLAPSPEQAQAYLESKLKEKSGDQNIWADISAPVYLQPLRTLLEHDEDPEHQKCLVGAMGAIITVDSTRALMELSKDRREKVRVLALQLLSWRLPDPRDTGDATSGPFRLYSQNERKADVKAAWDVSLKPKLTEIFLQSLKATLPDEVSAAAFGLSALGAVEKVPELTAAAERMAPALPVSKENEACVNQIADAASVLAQIGAQPCEADQKSAPGRLAVWANMVRTKKEYRKEGWEALIVYMLKQDSDMLKMAAIRWLPADFSKRNEVDWKALFVSTDNQIHFHSIQVAREKYPPDFRAIVERCLAELPHTPDNGWQSHERDFKELLEEIDAKQKKE